MARFHFAVSIPVVQYFLHRWVFVCANMYTTPSTICVGVKHIYLIFISFDRVLLKKSFYKSCITASNPTGEPHAWGPPGVRKTFIPTKAQEIRIFHRYPSLISDPTKFPVVSSQLWWAFYLIDHRSTKPATNWTLATVVYKIKIYTDLYHF